MNKYVFTVSIVVDLCEDAAPKYTIKRYEVKKETQKTYVLISGRTIKKSRILEVDSKLLNDLSSLVWIYNTICDNEDQLDTAKDNLLYFIKQRIHHFKEKLSFLGDNITKKPIINDHIIPF